MDFERKIITTGGRHTVAQAKLADFLLVPMECPTIKGVNFRTKIFKLWFSNSSSILTKGFGVIANVYSTTGESSLLILWVVLVALFVFCQQNVLG